jgi:hypothetical protein
MKKNLFTFPLFIGALLLNTALAHASSYNVLVNTSSLSGDHGSIDFQFNSGVGTFQSATVQIANFSGGTGGTQTVYGSGVVGGPAPAAISITNVAGQDNEVLDTYTFANSLAFTLNFSGPAITSPAGNNTAGSLFSFFVYSDAEGNNSALTTDPNGVALAFSLSPQGVLTDTIASPQVSITPEPASVMLLGGSLVGLAFVGVRRRLARQK